MVQGATRLLIRMDGLWVHCTPFSSRMFGTNQSNLDFLVEQLVLMETGAAHDQSRSIKKNHRKQLWPRHDTLCFSDLFGPWKSWHHHSFSSLVCQLSIKRYSFSKGNKGVPTPYAAAYIDFASHTCTTLQLAQRVSVAQLENHARYMCFFVFVLEDFELHK